jgi:hypothetical protein
MIESRAFHAEMRQAIEALDLDLAGLSVLTEAANDVYTATPLIACMAGADHVIAAGRDSTYGTFGGVRAELYTCATRFGIDTRNLEVVPRDSLPDLDHVSIVTNLGHVRPIDEELAGRLGSDCMISYMSESWEYRQGDIDLDMCKSREIRVAAVNEDHELVDSFRETGTIAVKALIDARLSLPYSDVLVVSRDKFGESLFQSLEPLCRRVEVLRDYDQIEYGTIRGFNVIIVADFMADGVVVGQDGIIPSDCISPHCTVIQYCGHNDTDSLAAAGIEYYPRRDLSPHRMSETLGDVSFRAVTRLYAAGLKVGQVVVQGNETGRWENLVQPMNY